MPSWLTIRVRQGSSTRPFPPEEGLPESFRGAPVFDPALCPDGCRACAQACPTAAVRPASHQQPASLDLGRCLFCLECSEACPEEALRFTPDHRMASRTRQGLLRPGPGGVEALDEASRRLFGRSLRLRHVSAGDCSACAAELQALGNVVFDLSRFGVQFVASPRHADGIVVTGPVTRNMETALRKTYDAVPSPRLVIATGACAISGGPFAGSPHALDGAEAVVPVDLFIPGCPPHPWTILDGLLGLLGRIEKGERR
ncbi:MAG TPA: NADH-quinone oxidoreductase subunit NuoB [Candidatus Polarisedimenticolia bacterium]|nr:NADH-quinone oxidoreductase subunit NuoB [Candidatus Polarisedimenticolia bacterium]